MRHLACLALLIWAAAAPAQEAAPGEPAMTVERLFAIVQAIDPDAEISGSQAQMTIRDVPVVIVADPGADRMRAMVPIRAVAGMSADELARVLQANFDTALDARYAVANGRLWSVYIHPLSPLERDQFVSGLGQTVNIALTYGTFYSGGALSYGGGDSAGALRELIDELLRRGQDI